MKFSKKIDTILSTGICLDEFHISNWALTKEQVLQVLTSFEDINVAVLGGDVIDKIDNVYGFTGSSWYNDRASNENYNDFVERSINETRMYILKYPTPVSDNIYFILVPGQLVKAKEYVTPFPSYLREKTSLCW